MPEVLTPPTMDPMSETRFRWTRCVPCNTRCTGRPRPIPGDGFTRCRDKVLRRDVLWRAWVAVRTNNGAPGIDRTTLDWIEKEYGIDRLLDELSGELRDGVVSAASGAAGVYPQARNDRASDRCRFPRCVTASCKPR